MIVEPLPANADLSRFRCDRWRRSGHDRLYVNELAPVGSFAPPLRLGYRDLMTGIDHPTSPQHRCLLVAIADDWDLRRRPPVPTVRDARHSVTWAS